MFIQTGSINMSIFMSVIVIGIRLVSCRLIIICRLMIICRLVNDFTRWVIDFLFNLIVIIRWSWPIVLLLRINIAIRYIISIYIFIIKIVNFIVIASFCIIFRIIILDRIRSSVSIFIIYLLFQRYYSISIYLIRAI